MTRARRPLVPSPLVFGLLALLALPSCGDEDQAAEPLPPPPPSEPLFPADFDQTFTEVRNCRPSSEHDLSRVRVFADPQALDAYQTRAGEIPEGALLVKEEYDGTDAECEGDVVQWTVMQRLVAGSSPDTLDWQWQRVNATRQVVTDNDRRCTSCHTSCGEPPDGFLYTCALP